MNETFSRVLFGLLFVFLVYQSVYSHTFYSVWITGMFIGCIYEFCRYRENIHCGLMMMLYLYAYYLICVEVGRGSVLMIIFYNFVSDAIQFIFGKMFGYTVLFPVTTKTLEGYVAGVVLPAMIFDFGEEYILLNLIGMCGGLLSSFIKRGLNIKNWSNIFGAHGGFNDRMDSIVIPIIAKSLMK